MGVNVPVYARVHVRVHALVLVYVLASSAER